MPSVGGVAAPAARADDRAAMRAAQRTVFGFAWGLSALCALCVDFPSWSWSPAPSVAAVGMGAAALHLVLRPGHARALPILAGASLPFYAARMPLMPNHFLFACLVDVAIVLACVQRRSWRGAESFAPVGRWMLVALYLLAVLHKLNHDYLDPEVSSAWALYRETAARLPALLPTWPSLAGPTIAGSLAVEAGMPLLLALRSTRRAAFAVAVAFHGFLALHPNPYVLDFSVLVLATLTLFLTEEEARRALGGSPARALRRGRAALPALSRRAQVAATLAPAAAALVAAVTSTPMDPETARALAPLRTAPGAAAVALFAAGLVVPLLRGPPSAPPARPWAVPRSALGAAAALGLVVANGLTPYTGLKSQTSFSMFSNLRCEGGETNHLFLPMLSDGPGARARAVEVIDASDPEILLARDRGERVVWFEARRRLARQEGAFMTWREHGRVVTADRRGEPGHELFTPIPVWTRKLVVYRLSVPPPGAPVPNRH